MRAKMAAGVIRVLLIYFIILAYSDDFSPYGWTQSGFKHFCLEDIHGCFSDGFLLGNSGREFSLIGSHMVIKRRELSSLVVFQPRSKTGQAWDYLFSSSFETFCHGSDSAC